MERQTDGSSLIGGLTADLGGPRTAGFLDKATRAIDVAALADLIRRDVAPDPPRGGRPFWPADPRVTAASATPRSTGGRNTGTRRT